MKPLKIFSTALAAVALCSLPAVAQATSDSGNLETVLKKMDDAAAKFQNTQASFEWDTYKKVIDEVDLIQSGTIYYRRAGKEIEMKADITKPKQEFLMFKDGEIQDYQPGTNQLKKYDTGKNRADVESYLVLGFGGSGQALAKSFDVTYLGPETINNVVTAKLQLIPKSEKVKGTFARILLWIDVESGISTQQQFFEPGGDYRLAKYSSIHLNEKKFPGDVFQLKTNSKTQIIAPHG